MPAVFGLSYELTVALLTLACLCAASLGTLHAYPRLPAHYRDDETLQTVRLVANIFGMLSSLVLGFMVSSANSNFEDADKAVHAYATEIILLDHSLRGLGQDGAGLRTELSDYVATIVGSREIERAALPTENRTAETTLRDIRAGLIALPPGDPAWTEDRDQAKAHVDTLLRTRWGLIERKEATIPFPLLVSLVLWLSMTMASLGYRAPRNWAVRTIFVVASLLLSGAILLILDLANPFDGPIQASSAPFVRALAELKL
ncbi:hypothetical protein [Kaistia nematophila]|uniref:DUF4239 domain-containing protein n=1 Tax=Kaistia nematophila TaxID=2994654 RepID=A0A9X3EAY7_9HYPH|nr:hypothetical protein [Kaistia nematophila]MCX5572323.1 hypothetical protein [Kaistia nematophila]